jgi:hypothetical protein
MREVNSVCFFLLLIIPDFFSGWTKRELAKNKDLTRIMPLCEDTQIPRVDHSTTSVAEFRRLYEDPAIPCVVINGINDWPAVENWKPERFTQLYHNEKFKVYFH